MIKKNVAINFFLIVMLIISNHFLFTGINELFYRSGDRGKGFSLIIIAISLVYLAYNAYHYQLSLSLIESKVNSTESYIRRR